MAVIEKKILKDSFDKILEGKKKWERRTQDFEIKEGDTLHLKEWDAVAKKYTGREIKKVATYVAKFDMNNDYWPKAEIEKYGYQIIQFD